MLKKIEYMNGKTENVGVVLNNLYFRSDFFVEKLLAFIARIRVERPRFHGLKLPQGKFVKLVLQLPHGGVFKAFHSLGLGGYFDICLP